MSTPHQCKSFWRHSVDDNSEQRHDNPGISSAEIEKVLENFKRVARSVFIGFLAISVMLGIIKLIDRYGQSRVMNWMLLIIIATFILTAVLILTCRKKKPALQFFIYAENGNFTVNGELLDKLSPKDVAHLSRSERKFFRYYMTKGIFDLHAIPNPDSRPSQERQCQIILKAINSINSKGRDIPLRDIF